MDPLSDKNPLIKQIRRAVSKGTLTEDGFAIAEGLHLLKEAIASDCEIGAIVVAESAAERLGDREARVVTDRTFASLSSTEAPQGVLALVKPPEWTLNQVLCGETLAVILDGLQDPGNAGAALRAAEAFGATGAILLKETVNPYNPKCMRASAGSVFRLPLIAGGTVNEIGEALARERIHLYAAMPRAELVAAEADFKTRCAVAIGSEGHGVSTALQARATGVRIATWHVESLNAAVAAGVLFYEARRQRSRG